MQDVEMRRTAALPFEPVKEVARFEERRIERPAVEADQRTGPRELGARRGKQLALIAESHEHELPRHERAVFIEGGAPDEKRVRSGAAAESGGLEIEKHERH